MRKNFYDGLIADLMNMRKFTMAENIFEDKSNEKFEVGLKDEFIGLNIYASQKKYNEYKEKFEILIGHDTEEYPFSKEIASQLGNTLTHFEDEKFKNDRLMLTERLMKKMSDNYVHYEASLFHNVMYVLTESQQWKEVANLLKELLSSEKVTPTAKTISYLKANLVYSFENSVRLEVQEAIQNFERKFLIGKSRNV